jgi:hypothetical protein
MWSYESEAAYKSLDGRRDSGSMYLDRLKESRILFPLPQQRHRNISCFIELAQIRIKDIASSAVPQESGIINMKIVLDNPLQLS